MNLDTPLVEYLIIGAHTMVWIGILVAWLLGMPFVALTDLDPTLLAFGLPFIYLMGMLSDDLSHQPLDRFRKRIRAQYYDPDDCKDEMIAYSSESLYSAYEARVRRIRIIGVAIFNWPLIGLSLLLYTGTQYWQLSMIIITFSIILCLASCWTWHNLYHRAYKFRKAANDIIKAHRV